MVKVVNKKKSFFSSSILKELLCNMHSSKMSSKIKKNSIQEDCSMGFSLNRRSSIIKKIRSNESVFKVDDGQKFSINNSRLSSSGNTTNIEESNCHGTNACVLAKQGSSIDLRNSTVTTTGKGANAVFSHGENSIINIDNVVIKTKGDYSNGISAGYRGTIQAHDISISTEGNKSSNIAVCSGNGIINASNITGMSEGEDSPCIYSKGNIVITDSNFKSEKSLGAVVDGSSIIMNNTCINSKENMGVLMFQKKEKNEEIGKCVFTSNLGSISAGRGPVFYVTNTEAIITLFNTKLNPSITSNILVNACKDKWGEEGENGGKSTLIGNHQTLKGDILCDEISSVNLDLKAYTYYTGIIDERNKGNVSIELDSTSVWTLTGNSYIDYLKDDNKEFKNIIDNGYTIFYNAENEKNNWLEGKEYTLSGGGKLIPA